jgi:hypothetical protein
VNSWKGLSLTTPVSVSTFLFPSLWQVSWNHGEGRVNSVAQDDPLHLLQTQKPSFIYLFIYLGSTGFQFRALHLLGRCCASYAMPSALEALFLA